ncbi:PilZ domain-containing protein [Vibrio vulnificus]
MTMQNHDDQKRKYYRLKYPVKALPRVRINGDVYHVNEVSEGGLRVTLSSIHQFHQGLMIRGTLQLLNCVLAIEGRILRFDQDEVVLKLSKGPSFKHMAAEQRCLLQHFPTHIHMLRRAAANQVA